MNEILIDNLANYKSFVETTNPEELAVARAKDRETLRDGNKQFWENFRVNTFPPWLTSSRLSATPSYMYPGVCSPHECLCVL